MAYRIFIDSGHGGKDSGAVGNGLQEKHLTLSIAQKIKSYLDDFDNVQIMLSRTNDSYLTLEQRTKLANDWGADLFISVHINAASSASATGFETFIHNGSVQQATAAFQNVLHEQIMKQIAGVQDRGKKRANYHVLRETHMPAVLTENLFINNASDSKKLKAEDFINQLALGHANGVAAFLGLKKKARAPIAKEPEKVQGKLYLVQIGAFSERENAEALAEQARAKGFKGAFIREL